MVIVIIIVIIIIIIVIVIVIVIAIVIVIVIMVPPSPSAGPGGVSSVIDRQTLVTPSQSIHTMGVMGHMIVINSAFPTQHNHTVHSSFEDNFRSKLPRERNLNPPD